MGSRTWTAAAGSALALAGAVGAPPATAGSTPAVVVQVSDAAVQEGAGGLTPAVFQVRRTGPDTGRKVTVSYTTADGTALAGSDYVARSGTLVFDAKTSVHTVVVDVIGDTDQEPDEHFLLVVTPSGGGDGEGRGTVQNDDGWPPS